MLSSSTNDTRLSRANSDVNNDTSIDDIFTHLTIQQVQKLNKEYKQNVTNAKNDLHGLVGNKYRDLIKIAEDISNMYVVTSEVDQKLSDLSYGSSRFVSFNTLNSFSKYNSSIRKKEASDARRNEKLTILKNIINNQLMSFEIRLLSWHRRPPLKDTSNYIYYAKCYYTLENIFKDTLKTDMHLADKLAAFKASFISFLEAELSSYNAFSLTSYSNDAGKYKPSQNLIWEDIISSSNEYLVDDNLDDLSDEDEEGISFQDTDYNEDSDTEENLHETYNKSSSPIINYLTAYIILNQNNEELDTLTKVCDKFVNLRYCFLDNVFSKILSTSNSEDTPHINFYKIFKHVENTFDYVSKYFVRETATQNELLRNLKQATGTWKASNSIGFHNWIENEDVKFDQDLVLSNVSSQTAVSVTIDKFSKLLSTFSDNLIKKNSNNRGEGINHLSNVFVILHNFIISLKKLDVSMITNGSSSKLVELLSSSLKGSKTIVTDLLENVISKTKNIYALHFEALSKELEMGAATDILSTVKQRVAHRKFNSESPSFDLFSSNLVETIDADLNKYIDFVAQISSLPSLSTTNYDICHQINIWFDTYFEYKDIITIEKESDLNRLTASNCLSHLSVVLLRNKSTLSGKWGNFSRDLLLQGFETLTANFNETLYDKIDNITEQIELSVKSSEKNNDLETLYYLLRVLLALSDRLVTFDENNKQNARVCKSTAVLHALCKDIFGSIVKIIPSLSNNDDSSFIDSFDKFIDHLFGCLSDTLTSELPNRPSLNLSSLMFYLASKYLSPLTSNYSKDYEYGRLFLNQQVYKTFIELKKEWILKDLIQNRMIDVLSDSLVDNTDDNKGDVENKEGIENKGKLLPNKNERGSSSITKEKFLLIFANIVYLLQFANGTPINDVTDILIQEHIKKLNQATKDEVIIDDLSMKLIVKDIAEFYKSNRGIYLPLLIS